MLESESSQMSPIKQVTPAVKESCNSIENIENMNEMEEINQNQEELKDFFKEYADEDDNKEYI